MKVKNSQIPRECLDDLWAKREFIQGLHKVVDEKYEELKLAMIEQGMVLDKNLEEWLFDFVHNSGDIDYFDEWLWKKEMLIEDE